MKQLMTKFRYSNPEYNETIGKLKDDLRSRVVLLAKEHAEQNLPANSTGYKMLVHAVIETEIQQAMYLNETTHLPIAGMVVAKKLNDDAAVAMREKSAALTDKRHALTTLNSTLSRNSINPWRRVFRWVVHIALVVIAIGEGVLSYTAFRYAQFSTLTAKFAAFAVAAVVGLGTLWAADFVAKARSWEWKIVRFVLVATPYAVLFYGLGKLRANALNNPNLLPLQDRIDTVTICWVDLAILSFSLFALALVLSIWIWQSKEEKQREFEHLEHGEKAEKLATEIQKLEEDKATIQFSASEQAAAALHRYEYARSIENDLVLYGKQMQQVYLETNIRHRVDRQVPEFFANLPSFKFQLSFHPLNQMKDETGR